jgi:tRNA (guanine9-N1)-methyltransferase
LASFANHIGASSWPVNKHAAPLLEVYPATDCIFLSPDADEPLLELDPQKVYVIGGIVDRSVRKGLTLGKAERHGLAAVRLPVLEYAKHLNLDGPSASNRPVLNVSDVVVALVEFARTGDWVHALRAAVPARKQRGGSDSSSQDEG